MSDFENPDTRSSPLQPNSTEETTLLRTTTLIGPIDYLLFALRTLLSPLTYLQKKLKIKPLWFWVGAEMALVYDRPEVIVLLIAWLKK